MSIEGMTKENQEAVALGLFALWFLTRLFASAGLFFFHDDGTILGVFSWFVLGLARPAT